MLRDVLWYFGLSQAEQSAESSAVRPTHADEISELLHSFGGGNGTSPDKAASVRDTTTGQEAQASFHLTKPKIRPMPCASSFKSVPSSDVPHAQGHGSTAMQSLLTGHHVRLVIRGKRRVGKTTLMEQSAQWFNAWVSELKSGTPTAAAAHPTVSSSSYVPSASIQGTTVFWRPSTVQRSNHDAFPAEAIASSATSTNSSIKARRVEIWDIVDRGMATSFACSFSSPADVDEGLKAAANTMPLASSLQLPTDATTVDVYKNCDGVVLMFDITRRETFEYVEQEVPRIPRHIPIAICGNFYDVARADPDRREVPLEDINRLLEKCHRTVPTLVDGLTLLMPAAQVDKSTGLRIDKNTLVSILPSSLKPVYISMSAVSGFGLKPLHSFIGNCIAYREAMEAESMLLVRYHALRDAVATTDATNNEQDYDEFSEWKRTLVEIAAGGGKGNEGAEAVAAQELQFSHSPSAVQQTVKVSSAREPKVKQTSSEKNSITAQLPSQAGISVTIKPQRPAAATIAAKSGLDDVIEDPDFFDGFDSRDADDGARMPATLPPNAKAVPHLQTLPTKRSETVAETSMERKQRIFRMLAAAEMNNNPTVDNASEASPPSLIDKATIDRLVLEYETELGKVKPEPDDAPTDIVDSGV